MNELMWLTLIFVGLLGLLSWGLYIRGRKNGTRVKYRKYKDEFSQYEKNYKRWATKMGVK